MSSSRRRSATRATGDSTDAHAPTLGATAEVRLPAVRVTELTRRFGDVTALESISFDVRKGSCSGSWGPTVPARPPPCGCSPAYCAPTPATRRSAASASPGPRGGEAPHRLHVAALRAVWRSHGPRRTSTSTPTCIGVPRAERRGASGATVSPSPTWAPFERRLAGQALGRHEAEALALLRADPPARGAAAGRAHLRRRSDLPARPLAHPARDGGARG